MRVKCTCTVTLHRPSLQTEKNQNGLWHLACIVVSFHSLIANLIPSCSVLGKSAQLVFGKYYSPFSVLSANFIHVLSLSKTLIKTNMNHPTLKYEIWLGITHVP